MPHIAGGSAFFVRCHSRHHESDHGSNQNDKKIMDAIGNIMLETIRVSVPEFIRLVFAGMAGGVIGAYANDKLTRKREADRDQRLKDEAAAAQHRAIEAATRLTTEQAEIIRECLAVAAPMRGSLQLLGIAGFGSWVRAGKRDFMEQTDPSVQARYMDAFESFLARDYFRHETGRAYRLTSKGYEK